MMQLQSLSFLFLFLPFSIAVFYACPNRLKSAALSGISILFYTLNDFTHVPLLLGSILYDYLMGFWIVLAKGDLKQRKIPYWLCVIKNLALMLVYGAVHQIYKTALPLGLLIFTTTAMGYIIDIYHGDEQFDKNIFRFILFCTFFGKLFAGPIVQYSDMRYEMEAFDPQPAEAEESRKPSGLRALFHWGGPAFSLEGMSRGFGIFIGGLAKIVILAEGSGKVYQLISDLPAGAISVLSSWMLMVSFTFTLYFTLSGYCDMAQGLAGIFGLKLPDNFYHPFQSRTVSDFFNRFNITVTRFINRYVYVFLGGDSNGKLSTAVNTLLITMLMGLWFGIRLNYLVWGIYFTGFILLEKYWMLKYLEKIPPVFDRLYTFATVMMSFTIFAGSSLTETGAVLRSMFGLNGLPWMNSSITYILSANYLIILLCFLFATSLPSIAVRLMREHLALFSELISAVLGIGLLLVTTAFLL